MKIRFLAISLIAALLVSGCSTSSSNSSGTSEDANISVEESSSPSTKPDCKDILEPKKIDRNPVAFVGKCGVLYIKVIDAQRPEDCQVRANYDSKSFEYGNFESYMNFIDCNDALDFYTGEYYKVTAQVNGAFTFETVLGASRTLADLVIVDVLD
jgi:hypothetical protein